jgi:HAD superfamily hydrolase (TIGR01509 family)
MTPNFQAVLFDCDGVLVDSEAITLGVLQKILAEMGWVLTMPEVRHHFLGRLVRDNQALIEEHTGRSITAEWTAQFMDRRDAALSSELTAIAGVEVALEKISARFGERIACASGADRRKIYLQLNKVGLLRFFTDRCFSGFEQARSKPYPDVYLAAASALGANIAHCAVIEDSPTGIKAGVSAGAYVFAFVSPDNPHVDESGGLDAYCAQLKALGAHAVFHSMDELPALVGA